MATGEREAGGNADPVRMRSVERALALLQTLAEHPAGATPKEISRDLGLHLSTVYRLLNTLVGTGFVTRAASSGLFRLGPTVPRLHHAFQASLGMDPRALPILQALQVTTGETVQLIRLDGDQTVLIGCVEGSRSGFIPGGYLGFACPAYTLAAGRVLLAGLSAAALAAYLARLAADQAALAAGTVPAGVAAELRQIKADGYAVSRGRIVCCVAAPVAAAGAPAPSAIAVLTPAGRFDAADTTVAAVLGAARVLGSVVSAGAGPGAVRPLPDPTAAAVVASLLKGPPSARYAVED